MEITIESDANDIPGTSITFEEIKTDNMSVSSNDNNSMSIMTQEQELLLPDIAKIVPQKQSFAYTYYEKQLKQNEEYVKNVLEQLNNPQKSNAHDPWGASGYTRNEASILQAKQTTFLTNKDDYRAIWNPNDEEATKKLFIQYGHILSLDFARQLTNTENKFICDKVAWYSKKMQNTAGKGIIFYVFGPTLITVVMSLFTTIQIVVIKFCNLQF